MLKLDAQTVVVTFEGVGTYTMSVETLVIYSRRALRAIAFLTPEARKGLVEQFSPTEPGPTMADLATAVGISDDTFARVRKAAGVDHGLRGTKARGYRYSPEMVAKLIAAAMAGKYLERKAMAEKWSKWSRANRN